MRRPLPWIVTVIAFGAAVAIDIAMASSHVPGYSAAIGFLGCVIVVVVAKGLGKTLIQRSEGHWPDDVPADEQEDLGG